MLLYLSITSLVLCSLIKQLFHPHKLAVRLSKFWINMLKKYKHSVLTDD